MLVNDSKVHPISHCFPVIMQYLSNYHLGQRGAFR